MRYNKSALACIVVQSKRVLTSLLMVVLCVCVASLCDGYIIFPLGWCLHFHLAAAAVVCF